MMKIAKCYAENFKKSDFLCFRQISLSCLVTSDNKKVCAPEDTHTEKCRPSFATTQNHSLPIPEYAK